MSFFDKLTSLIEADPSSSASAADRLAAIGCPSTSIAILEDGKISSHCYSTIGNTPETIFQACSISKAVNAVGIMRLIDQGHLTLSSTIVQVLPASALDILTSGSPISHKKIIESITVRQLLSHTAGLSTPDFPGYPTSQELPTSEQILLGASPTNTMRVHLNALPGLEFNYAGGGTAVLQVMVEHITKKPYAEALDELVIKPLNMTRSFYGTLPDGEKNFAACYTNSTTPWKESHHNQPELSAAGLWTTPSDLLKVISAVQTSLTSDNGFLKQQTAKDMTTEVDSHVASGWFVPTDNSFSHTGSNEPAYRCIVIGFKDKNNGISAMTNSPYGTYTILKTLQAASHLHGWDINPAMGVYPVMTPFSIPVAGDDWKAWKGEWTDAKKRTYVFDGDDAPTLDFNGFGPIKVLKGAVKDKDVYVLDSLDMTLRLKEKDGKRELQLVYQNTGTVIDLKKEE